VTAGTVGVAQITAPLPQIIKPYFTADVVAASGGNVVTEQLLTKKDSASNLMVPTTTKKCIDDDELILVDAMDDITMVCPVSLDFAVEFGKSP
jgi:hypothetical protein